jgi:hypothetical protein
VRCGLERREGRRWGRTGGREAEAAEGVGHEIHTEQGEQRGEGVRGVQGNNLVELAGPRDVFWTFPPLRAEAGGASAKNKGWARPGGR